MNPWSLIRRRGALILLGVLPFLLCIAFAPAAHAENDYYPNYPYFYNITSDTFDFPGLTLPHPYAPYCEGTYTFQLGADVEYLPGGYSDNKFTAAAPVISWGDGTADTTIDAADWSIVEKNSGGSVNVAHTYSTPGEHDGTIKYYYESLQSNGTWWQWTYTTDFVIWINVQDSMSVAPATGTYGNETTLSATLTSNGSGIANASVEWKVNGSDYGYSYTNASGVATIDVYPPFAGMCDVEASFAGGLSDYYEASSDDNVLTTAQRPITVTADSQTKIYGSADPTLTYHVTSGSLVYGDTCKGSLSRAAGQTVDGSPYAISQGTLTAGTNYKLTYVGANLTITPAALTVTAKDAGKTYGAPDPTFTYTLSGFVNGDTASSAGVTGTPTISRAPGESVGTYAINVTDVSAMSAANYSFAASTTPGTFTITPAALTVTAKDAGKTYGTTLSFAGTEFKTDGLVNGDAVNSVSLISSGAAASAPVGSYAIVPSAASGSGLGNYTISYVNGTLTVIQTQTTEVAGFAWTAERGS
jgi:hypothetical protein